MKKVIWLDDNPSLLEQEKNIILSILEGQGVELLFWNGEKEKGSKSGEACLKFFKDSIFEYQDDLVGFILDIRIPVINLSELEMSDIITRNGLMTGIVIAYYFLRNATKKSPIEGLFRNTPILLLSIAPGINIEEKWIDKDDDCEYLVKGSNDMEKKLQLWVRSISHC